MWLFDHPESNVTPLAPTEQPFNRSGFRQPLEREHSIGNVGVLWDDWNVFNII